MAQRPRRGQPFFSVHRDDQDAKPLTPKRRDKHWRTAAAERELIKAVSNPELLKTAARVQVEKSETKRNKTRSKTESPQNCGMLRRRKLLKLSRRVEPTGYAENAAVDVFSDALTYKPSLLCDPRLRVNQRCFAETHLFGRWLYCVGGWVS
jgi:hypothetical protein